MSARNRTAAVQGPTSSSLPASEVIRASVQEAVDSVLWLEQVNKEDEIYRQNLSSIGDTYFERCMICTLPLGTCPHNEGWIQKREEERYLGENYKSDLDLEIDAALDGIGDELQLESKSAEVAVDLQNMRWSPLNELPLDKIGSSPFSLFAPDDRFWHTCTCLDNDFLVVFGGFRYKSKDGLEPFKSVVDTTNIEILSDLRVYDIKNRSWYGLRGVGENAPVPAHLTVTAPPALVPMKNATPKCRYGHCATALDTKRILIFGGRGERGVIYNDTWIYSMETDLWTEVIHPPNLCLPVPGPRFFGNCVSELDKQLAYLFGGTNGSDNFGDLWKFNGNPDKLYWERAIAVGLPPSPRYGHQMVFVPPSTIVVLGGCAVSPESEMVGSNFTLEETLNLMSLSADLQKKYSHENNSAVLGTGALQMSIDVGDSALGDLYKQAADLSRNMYLREQETRVAEQQMVDAFKLAKSNVQYNVKRARHPNPVLDVFYFNIQSESWEERRFPRPSGPIPCSRIHFSAANIGDFIFVLGGAHPTSLVNRHVDQSPGELFVMDMKTHAWVKPLPVNSFEYMKESVKLAETDLIRAREKCKAEKIRSISLGAPGGITKEMALADSMYKVCKWRYDTIVQEQQQAQTSPEPCYGASFTAIRQRLLYIGGWTDKHIVRKGIMVLEVEHEIERQRRLQEEFYATLERERRAEEVRLTMENVITAHALREKALQEKRDRERELHQMAIQDFMSSLPPLSQPPPVKFVKSNRHTIWISWDRILRDTKKNLVEKEAVTYFLYMKSSFQNLLVGDRVLVLAKDASKKNKKNKSTHTTEQKEEAFEEGKIFNPKYKRFPGEIMKLKGKGRFDVLFDDGTTEADIPRHRIQLDPSYYQVDENEPSALPSPTNSVGSFNGPASSKKAVLLEKMDGASFSTSVRKRLKSKSIKRERSLSLMQQKFRESIAPKHNMPMQSSNSVISFDSTDVNELADGEESPSKFSMSSSVTLDHTMFRLDATMEEENSNFDRITQNDSKITVVPDATWKLVYVGNDNRYACTSIVPRAILDTEPHLRVSVMFAIQSHGLDWPRYERSQLSRPAIFYTTPEESNQAEESISRPASPTTAIGALDIDTPAIPKKNDEDDLFESNAMSKTKKEIFTAVIKGQQMVQIERRAHYYYAEGAGEDYV